MQKGRSNTFHSQWYRVKGLRLQLRSGLRIRRQSFWGEPWYILTCSENNEHFRLSVDAYKFVSHMKSSKTLEEIWNQHREIDGPAALGQGEVISLLGMLHSSNLLHLDTPADMNTLFARKQRRRLRKLGGGVSNFLFTKFPLWNPDCFLNRFLHIGKLPFQRFGVAVWLLFMVLACHALIINWDSFMSGAGNSISAGNMVWLYVVLLITKTVHEFGHAFACKYFGGPENGEVNTMGIMLLLFTPMPYVDVSSSWQVRSKWHRAIIAGAGIYVELFIAFLAVLLWAHTPEGTLINALSRDCIVVASLGTVLFNLNPLLRFDGYFIFSDMIEMPNLYQRSQQYSLHLIKQYVLGFKDASTPVERRSERIFYPIYAVAAFIYRCVITVGIFFFLENSLLGMGVILSFSLFIFWFVMPLIKGVKYLIRSNELAGRRSSCIIRASIAAGIVGVLFFVLPFPDSVVAQGVVEPRDATLIYSPVEGTLDTHAATDIDVINGETVVAVIEDQGLLAEMAVRKADMSIVLAQQKYAMQDNDVASYSMHALQLEGLRREQELAQAEWDSQIVHAPSDGVWIAPDLDKRSGKWISRGEVLGLVYNPQDYRLRIAVDQFDAARLFREKIELASFRIAGRCDAADGQREKFVATIEGSPLPAGKTEIIHPALTHASGGTIAVKNDGNGMVAERQYFEIRLLPQVVDGKLLLPGQRVWAKLSFSSRPLAFQIARRLRQVFQRS